MLDAYLRMSIAAGQSAKSIVATSDRPTHKVFELLRQVGARRLPEARDNARVPLLWRACYILVQCENNGIMVHGSEAHKQWKRCFYRKAHARHRAIGAVAFILVVMYAACSGVVKNFAIIDAVEQSGPHSLAGQMPQHSA